MARNDQTAVLIEMGEANVYQETTFSPIPLVHERKWQKRTVCILAVAALVCILGIGALSSNTLLGAESRQVRTLSKGEDEPMKMSPEDFKRVKLLKNMMKLYKDSIQNKATLEAVITRCQLEIDRIYRKYDGKPDADEPWKMAPEDFQRLELLHTRLENAKTIDDEATRETAEGSIKVEIGRILAKYDGIPDSPSDDADECEIEEELEADSCKPEDEEGNTFVRTIRAAKRKIKCDEVEEEDEEAEDVDVGADTDVRAEDDFEDLHKEADDKEDPLGKDSEEHEWYTDISDEEEEKARQQIDPVVYFYKSEDDAKSKNPDRGFMVLDCPRFGKMIEGNMNEIENKIDDEKIKKSFKNGEAFEVDPVLFRLTPMTTTINGDRKRKASVINIKGPDFKACKEKEPEKRLPLSPDTRSKFDNMQIGKGSAEVGHILGWLNCGSNDESNLFLQNREMNMYQTGVEISIRNFLTNHENGRVDLIIEQVKENANDKMPKEVIWHVRFTNNYNLVGERHFKMPNPKGWIYRWYEQNQGKTLTPAKNDFGEDVLTYDWMEHAFSDWKSLREKALELVPELKDVDKFTKLSLIERDRNTRIKPIFIHNKEKTYAIRWAYFKLDRVGDVDRKSDVNWVKNNLKDMNCKNGDSLGHGLTVGLYGSDEKANIFCQNYELNVALGKHEHSLISYLKNVVAEKHSSVNLEFIQILDLGSGGNVNRPTKITFGYRVMQERNEKIAEKIVIYSAANPLSSLIGHFNAHDELMETTTKNVVIELTKPGEPKLYTKYPLYPPKAMTSRGYPFVCPIDGRTYSTWNNLREHIRSHDIFRTKGMECKSPTCGYTTRRISYMNRHYNDIHGVANAESLVLSKKELKCDKKNGNNRKTPCTFTTWEQHLLDRHLEAHKKYEDKIYRYGCTKATDCPFRSGTKSRLQRHEDSVHDPNFSYEKTKCPYCEDMIASKMKRHIGNKHPTKLAEYVKKIADEKEAEKEAEKKKDEWKEHGLLTKKEDGKWKVRCPYCYSVGTNDVWLVSDKKGTITLSSLNLHIGRCHLKDKIKLEELKNDAKVEVGNLDWGHCDLCGYFWSKSRYNNAGESHWGKCPNNKKNKKSDDEPPPKKSRTDGPSTSKGRKTRDVGNADSKLEGIARDFLIRK